MLSSTALLTRRAPLAASRAAAGASRSLGMKARNDGVLDEPIPPNYTIDSVKPPKHWASPGAPEKDPNEYVRGPVTSAHAVDIAADPPRLSARDSAAFSPTGAVVHGRYGELDPDATESIPLEYLALLRHSAEGAAAVRTISSGKTGTILVYGATQPAGLATTQLASTSGCAVVAVVDGQHSGNDEMVDIVKGMASEPGTAIPEEYALLKRNFRDIVDLVSQGDDPSTWPGHDPDAFLEDFKQNLKDYVEFYPDTLPAACSADHMDFAGKEKDRANFSANMSAYLSQLPPGEAPLDPEKLDAYFPKEQYAAWKAKFGKQTTAVISGDDAPDFVPSNLVRNMVNENEEVDPQILKPIHVSEGAGDYVPYEPSVLDRRFGEGSAIELPSGGPVLGAVVVVTPTLQSAAEAVHKVGKSLRSKAESLQFLTQAERKAFAAASAVVGEAQRAGGAVAVVGGSLPGLDAPIEPTDGDVKEALAAMDVDEKGESRLNFFLQVYRASDFPVYADYAIHRATEPLSGPRTIVVTK